jgi:hypothetical protein
MQIAEISFQKGFQVLEMSIATAAVKPNVRPKSLFGGLETS